MTLSKIIKILREASICKEKKTLLRYFDTKIKQMYIKKVYISGAVENGKYMNYQYNSEQMFIICSNRIKIKYNRLLETSCFNVHQKIKRKLTMWE